MRVQLNRGKLVLFCLWAVVWVGLESLGVAFLPRLGVAIVLGLLYGFGIWVMPAKVRNALDIRPNLLITFRRKP